MNDFNFENLGWMRKTFIYLSYASWLILTIFLYLFSPISFVLFSTPVWVSPIISLLYFVLCFWQMKSISQRREDHLWLQLVINLLMLNFISVLFYVQILQTTIDELKIKRPIKTIYY